MPKHVFLIDASLLKESDCDRKIDFIHNQGLTTVKAKFEADYGTAFHKFVALYNSGVDPSLAMQTGANYFLEKCLAVPEDDFRTIDHLMMTMQSYIKGPCNRDIDLLKPLLINNKPAVELQFSFPYHTTPEYDVLLTGTADLLGSYIDRKVINDYKVSASWRAQAFLDKYDLDPQLIFYSWVLKKYGITDDYLPALITMINIKKPTQSKNVGGKRVPVVGWNGAEVVRSALIEYSPEQIKEFEYWVEERINKIVNNWLCKLHKPNFNRCGDWNGCDFKHLCKEYDPVMRQLKQKSMFMVRVYDPSQFQK